MNRLIFLILVGWGTVWAQDSTQSCNSRIDASAPVARFDFDQGAGTAVDRQTGLMWQRCPLGYTFDDGATPETLADDACRAVGPSVFFWQEALQAAEEHNNAGLGGFEDWRVPNIHELATITERRCHHPALDLEVFPDTSDFALISRYWSSTPAGFGFYGTTAWHWNFRQGTSGKDTIRPDTIFSQSHYVRLVRTSSL